MKNDLYENLKDLMKTPFFRYLQMDLYRGCPFWDDNAMCTEPTCALNSVDEVGFVFIYDVQFGC